MAVELNYPHIVKSQGDPARLKRNPRVRVTQIVIDYLEHKWSAEEFCKHYPHLIPAEVHAALTYYYDNKEEIDGEIEAELKELKQLMENRPPSAFFLRMKAEGKL